MSALPSFGRYRALFRIASGGMAEVFAARITGEEGFEKLVAVKRMLPHLAEDPHFVDMFLDEARLAAQISSPHVVPTLDLGRAEDGALYIVMELVVGAPLSMLIREESKRGRTIPLPIALEVLAQAAQGLDDAHEATTPTGVRLELVHRDVSPHNVLVGVDGRARVTDFGVARAILRRTSTVAGELKGKFAYLSPEQAEGREVDRRADVFGLGIVAWEAIAGQRLFVGDTPAELLDAVKHGEIPRLDAIDPAITASVADVVARALSRPVDGRYDTAFAFASALRDVAAEVGERPAPKEIGRWVGETAAEDVARITYRIEEALIGDDVTTISRKQRERPSMAKIAGPPRTTPNVIVTAPAVVTEAETVVARPKRRPRRLAVALVVLVVALSITLLVLLVRRAAPPAPEPATSVATAAPSASSAAAPSESPTPIATASAPPTTSASSPPRRPHAPKPSVTKKKGFGPLLGDEAFGK